MLIVSKKIHANSLGNILARAKLSLLWDGKQPALFLERFYGTGSYEQQCREAILQGALQKAEQLQLPLAALNESYKCPQQKSFDRGLQSLGGGVSYEYSDGAQGVQPNGKFCIPKKSIITLF